LDPRDIDRIQRLAAGHAELGRLWDRHRALEAELAALDARRTLTPDEEVRRKELQKAKLAGRDRIQAILDRHA
jgi:uncharacterized protein YdcH (DUF465 family)